MSIAIRVSNLSKCYQLYDAPRDRLKQFVVPRLKRLEGRDIWAYGTAAPDSGFCAE